MSSGAFHCRCVVNERKAASRGWPLRFKTLQSRREILRWSKKISQPALDVLVSGASVFGLSVVTEKAESGRIHRCPTVTLFWLLWLFARNIYQWWSSMGQSKEWRDGRLVVLLFCLPANRTVTVTSGRIGNGSAGGGCRKVVQDLSLRTTFATMSLGRK